jgi:hypothetical protein
MRPVQSFQSSVRFSSSQTGWRGLLDAAAKAAEQKLIPGAWKPPPGSPVLTPEEQQAKMHDIFKDLRKVTAGSPPTSDYSTPGG